LGLKFMQDIIQTIDTLVNTDWHFNCIMNEF
jgi:hypothetical protein